MHIRTEPSVDLAIVGDGASATLVAIRALSMAPAGTRIALIGTGQPGLGIAYATPDESHCLNVPAGKMSALAEVSGDFVDFLCEMGLAGNSEQATLAARYVPRAWYGQYLGHRLQQAIGASRAVFSQTPAKVVGIGGTPGQRLLSLSEGMPVQAGRVVLAVGNTLRPLPVTLPAPSPPVIEAWDVPALQAVAAEASVMIVGTGLSMADTVLTLRTQGHRGPVHAVSRHGLLPLAHAAAAPWAFAGEALLSLDLRQRVSVLRREVARAQAAGQPWQAVFEAIRPLGSRLWTTLSAADQRRFLRHVVRVWDVHRHRIAPHVALVLDQALAGGQLQLHAGGVRAVQPTPDGRWSVRLATAETFTVDTLVNATGLQVRVAAMQEPLLQQLLADGVAAVGPHGLGLDVDVDAAGVARLRSADQRVQNDLLLLGSLRMGQEWETIAIPELRMQAQVTAAAALAACG